MSRGERKAGIAGEKSALRVVGPRRRILLPAVSAHPITKHVNRGAASLQPLMWITPPDPASPCNWRACSTYRRTGAGTRFAGCPQNPGCRRCRHRGSTWSGDTCWLMPPSAGTTQRARNGEALVEIRRQSRGCLWGFCLGSGRGIGAQAACGTRTGRWRGESVAQT